MQLSENARGYLSALPFALVLFALWPLIGLAKALAGATAVVVFSVLLEQNWRFRRKKPFQIAICVLALTHIAAIWLIPFEKPGSGLVAVPIAFVDYFVLSRFLGWIRKHFISTLT